MKVILALVSLFALTITENFALAESLEDQLKRYLTPPATGFALHSKCAAWSRVNAKRSDNTDPKKIWYESMAVGFFNQMIQRTDKTTATAAYREEIISMHGPEWPNLDTKYGRWCLEEATKFDIQLPGWRPSSTN